MTGHIRSVLEKQLGDVWVTGEVTNLETQSSGHIYFTLKDSAAQIGCVLFRGEYQVDRTLLQDGRSLNVRGHLTVYEVRGQYQLRVVAVEPQGQGALQIAFENLKARLNAEGLFAQARKRPLPSYPQRIGAITSPTGAALRDVLHVIERRNPVPGDYFGACRVQGEGAEREIARAINLLNAWSAQHASERPGLDLILLTRGGGSLEDLWAFNEEIVARAIFSSALPIVSAIGHEIDFTISDFVADLRAATPSAAAEIITQGMVSSCQFISQSAKRMRQLIGQRLADKEYEFRQAAQNLARLHPRRRLEDWVQRLDDLSESLKRCVSQGGTGNSIVARKISSSASAGVRPAVLLKQRREILGQHHRRLSANFNAMASGSCVSGWEASMHVCVCSDRNRFWLGVIP